MFANPFYSLAIIAALVALWFFVIKPRLHGDWEDTYSHITDWWPRQMARLYAFRSYVAAWAAGLLIALPDIIVAVAPIDLSWLVGPRWAQIWAGSLGAYLAINNAFKTKPLGVKAD